MNPEPNYPGPLVILLTAITALLYLWPNIFMTIRSILGNVQTDPSSHQPKAWKYTRQHPGLELRFFSIFWDPHTSVSTNAFGKWFITTLFCYYKSSIPLPCGNMKFEGYLNWYSQAMITQAWFQSKLFIPLNLTFSSTGPRGKPCFLSQTAIELP